jgi:hypothetical protein
MADVTRYNGDTGTVGDFISFIGANVTAFKVMVQNATYDARDIRTENGPGEAIEAILRNVATRATVLGYQVENTSAGQISLLVENGDWNATDLQANIRALGATVGNTSVDVSGSNVTTSGYKLA